MHGGTIAIRAAAPLLVLLLVGLLPPALPTYAESGLAWWEKPFTSWDVEWFLSIAGGGYTTEQRLAFFPMLPWLLRWLGLWGVILINCILRCVNLWLSTKLLGRLGVDGGKELIFALTASPITVFETAPYTESLFATCSMIFILLWVKGELYSVQILMTGLAGLTRNTTVFLAGYYLFTLLFNVPKGRRMISLALLPVPIVQTLVPLKCRLSTFYNRSVGVLESMQLYSAIQERYWNVGFGRYWKLKNLPRFLLASPWIYYSLHSLWMELQRILKEDRFRPSPRLAVCLHNMALCILVVSTANVEILTRILFSSTPWLYGYLSTQRKEDQLWKYLFVGYASLGCLLFGCFLPWT
ncbi:Phosphatidylinostol glycan, Class V [Giardia muris]|uniref:GPI mannosyltransferase 2 n=1 Tax=Giardia muris TaxID=5742 RepID=A0A4Z1SUV7_GIAMU|nr:Phosphatidylinostol glycan, Class V [Giardia muris]|eukprot:TNJ29672.1 Phosphatidylinostol glycan, Class V [Giardia muris]